MQIIDANAILRFVLNDNEEMAQKTNQLIQEETVLIKNEVLAEVVYVLLKVYSVDKNDACDAIVALISTKNIETESEDVLRCAVELFRSRKIDFVDSLLYAYNRVEGYHVFTFDKELRKLLKA